MAVVAELADGRRLEFPDGTDPSVVQATVKKMIGNAQVSTDTNKSVVAPAKPVTFTPEMTELTFAEKLAQKVLPKDGFDNQTVDNANNFAAGATSLNRGIGNLVAGEGTFKPKVSPTGNPVDKDSGRYFAGQIADPTSWAVGSGLGKLPVVGKAAQFQPVSGAGKAGKILHNVNAGSIQGGILGGLSEDGTALEGSIAGAVAGGVLPTAISGINYGANKTKHLFQNADIASGRFANEVAKHSGKRDQVVAALQEKNLPFTGTANSGQAAAKVGSPEFAALQEFSNSTKPTVAANLAGRQEAQRASTLNAIGRDENELAKAVANRASKSNPLYESARSTVANTYPIKEQMLESINSILVKNKNNDAIAIPLKEISKKIKSSSNFAPRDLMSLSDDIRDMLGKTNDGTPVYDIKVLTGLKEKLDGAIGKAVPEYTAARETFKNLSGPVNRMETGKLLQKTLKTPLDVGERGAVFAKAVDDAPKTLKTATGFSRYEKLSDVLDKTEVSAVDRVTQELMTNAAQKELAQRGMQAAGKILGAQIKPPQIPNPLYAPVTYGNSVLRFLTGKISDRTLNALAVNMNNPAKMAQLMQQASAAERDLIGKAMMQRATQGTTNIVARQQGEQ